MDSGVRRKLVDAWKRRTRRGCIAIRDIAGDKVGGKGEDIYFGTSGGNASVGLALLADCPPNVRTALVPHEGDFLSARVPTRGPTYNNPRLPRPGIGRRYDPAARPRT